MTTAKKNLIAGVTGKKIRNHMVIMENVQSLGGESRNVSCNLMDKIDVYAKVFRRISSSIVTSLRNSTHPTMLTRMLAGKSGQVQGDCL